MYADLLYSIMKRVEFEESIFMDKQYKKNIK